jgi:phage-related protein
MADEIFVGSVAVGVVPDARNWNNDLRRQLVPEADRIGNEYGSRLSKGIVDEMGRKKADYAKEGEKSGGAFADTFKKRIEAAIKAIPKVKLDGDATEADKKLQEIRRKMEELSKKKINVDMSAKDAMKELDVLNLELDKLQHKSKNIELKFNTKEAKAQLALLRTEVGAAGGGGRGGILGSIGGLFGLGGDAGSAGARAGGGAASSSPYAAAGIGAGIIAAAPFIGQAVSAAVVGGLGTALAGIGIAGAFGLGTSTGGPQKVAASQAALTQSKQREAIAQQHLNDLQKSGKATTQQLAQAHLSLSSAQAQVSANQTKLSAAQRENINQTSKQQLEVRKAFTDLKNQAVSSLSSIGVSFIPVLKSIAGTASSVLKQMTPVFKGVIAAISGPFKLFVDTILKAFTQPAVQYSIEAIGGAFIALLNAFTPMIPGIMQDFADAITQIATVVSQHPQDFANFVKFIFELGVWALKAIAWLSEIAVWIQDHWDIIKWIVFPVILAVMYVVQHFGALKKGISEQLNLMRSDAIRIWNDIWKYTIGAVITGVQKVTTWHAQMRARVNEWLNHIASDARHIWDVIWNNTVGRVIRGYQDVLRFFGQLRQGAIRWLNDLMNNARNIWNTVWANTVSRVVTGVNQVIGWFTNLKNRAVSFFSNAVSWLVSAGGNVISGLMNGMKNAVVNIGSWIKANIVDPVVNKIKSFFGIKSPSTVMFGVGQNLISGLLRGMISNAKDVGSFIGKIFGGWPAALGALVGKGLVAITKLPAKALKALGGIAGKIGGFFSKLVGGGGGGGVQRWLPQVVQALGMLGMPTSLAGRVLYQMQTESGGNPNAINNWDINAQHGDPSRGLMQVIGSTFAAYHVPGTSFNIYDPLANIAAAINYAMHRYGPTLGALGSGHGYDSGGWLPPGITVAVNNTGSPELVIPAHKLRARGGDGSVAGVAYHAHFDGLTGQAIEGHVQNAFVAMSLTQGALARNGRRS